MRRWLRSAQWWWWNLSLSRKGWLVVGVPLLVLLPTVLASLALNVEQGSIREDVREVRTVQRLASEVRQDLLTLESAVARAAAGDPDALADFDPVADRVESDLAALSERPDDDLVDAAVIAAGDQLAVLRSLRDDAEEGGAGDGDVAAMTETSAAVATTFGALDEATVRASDDGRDRLDDRSQLILWLLVVGSALAAISAVLMVRLFAKSIVKRVTTVNEVTSRVLDGNFHLELEDTGRDELGVLFENLRQAGDLLIALNDDLAGLADEERRRLERERQLRDVLHTVHGEIGRESILESAVRELAAALDADRAIVMSVEEGQMGALMAEWASDGLTPLGVGARLPPDPDRDAKIAQVITDRVVVVVDDVATSDVLLPQTRQVLSSIGVGSLLIAPVVTDEDALGLLALLTSGRNRPWPDDTNRLVRAVAGEVATALTHARLLEREREMVERLQELDQTRADFVASVSHELRTPLTSIRGYVEMLEDGDGGPISDAQRQMLVVVQRNTDRLLALIEDLLTLSRIEAGSFRVALRPTDLGALVRRTVEDLEPHAAGHGVTLVATVDADVPEVMGEAQQLERVLLNLLSNAVKFTPDGGEVEVRLTTAGDEAVLEVADHGIGIPEAEQPRLFGRFFRSSNAQDLAIQGTGLGLVIVKSIIDHHNGRIDVRSAPGEGTTFTVRIPATAGASDRERVSLS